MDLLLSLNTEGELIPRNVVFSNAVGFVLLLSFVILAWVKLIYSESFSQLIRRLFQKTNLESDFSTDTSRIKKAGFLLTLNYFINGGTFFYILYSYFSIQGFTIVFFLLIPTVFFLFLHFALFITGIVTGEEKSLLSNNQLITLTHQLVGIILLIVNLICYLNINHVTPTLKILAGILTLIYFYRIIKGFLLAFQNKISWFYIILYFCSLEILPMVIVYQFFMVK